MSLRGLAICLCWLFAMPIAESAPFTFRAVAVDIEVEAQQQWDNAPQWARTRTHQRYRFETVLRSTGTLEGANLLDPDLRRRTALKAEYVRRSGMAQIKAAGIDPAVPGLVERLDQALEKKIQHCGADADCAVRAQMEFAPLMAAASLPDHHELFDGEARYLFFFGYPGCANKVNSEGEFHLKGEATRTGKADRLKPFVLEILATSQGSPEEQVSLCERFTMVIDTKTGDIQIENVYLPAARGPMTRVQYGNTLTRDQEIPIPPPLQGWANSVLRSARATGRAEANLPLNLPLDGDSSVLGTWTGEATAKIRWSVAPLDP